MVSNPTFNPDPHHRIVGTQLPSLPPKPYVLRVEIDPETIPTPRSMGKQSRVHVGRTFHTNNRSVVALRMRSDTEINVELKLCFCLCINPAITSKEIIEEDSGEILRRKVPISEYIPEDLPNHYREFRYTPGTPNSPKVVNSNIVFANSTQEAILLAHRYDAPLMLGFFHSGHLPFGARSPLYQMRSFKEDAWGYYEITNDMLRKAVDDDIIGPMSFTAYTPLSEKSVKQLASIMEILESSANNELDINVNRVRKYEDKTPGSKKSFLSQELDSELAVNLVSSEKSYSLMIPKWLIRDTFNLNVEGVNDGFPGLSTTSVENTKLGCSYFVLTTTDGRDRSPLQQYIGIQRKRSSGIEFGPGVTIPMAYLSVPGQAILVPKPTLRDMSNFVHINEDNWEDITVSASPFTKKKKVEQTPAWLGFAISGTPLIEIMNSPLCPEDQTPILREALDYDTPEEQILFLKRHFKLLG